MGKDIIVADDILASGESLIDIAKELKKRKAGRIFLAATFGLFANGLAVFDKAYEQGLFSQLFVTNLSYLNPELRDRPWFTEVNLAKYIATLIATLNHEQSISMLLNPNDRIERILDIHRRRQSIAGGCLRTPEEDVYAPGS